MEVPVSSARGIAPPLVAAQLNVRDEAPFRPAGNNDYPIQADTGRWRLAYGHATSSCCQATIGNAYVEKSDIGVLSGTEAARGPFCAPRIAAGIEQLRFADREDAELRRKAGPAFAGTPAHVAKRSLSKKGTQAKGPSGS